MLGRRVLPPHPGGLRVLTLCLVLAVSACAPLSLLVPGGSSRGEVRVRVGERIVGGQPVATPPVPVPTDTPGAFRGQALVRVARAGSPTDVVAEGWVSDSTWTTFSVPAGRYWVFLPRDRQTTLANQSYAPAALPDGTVVDAWSEVTVPPNGAADAALVVTYRMP